MIDELLKEQLNNLVQQTLQDEGQSAKNQDFFQNNNTVEKKKVILKPYTTKRNKVRNFLWSHPDVYCNNERCGFDLKSKFKIKIKDYKDKKMK